MIKIASQFSGIGSFEQAITNLGIEHENIMAVDFDKYARQTYTANFGEPKHYFVDSYNADYENVENVDVFLSSPPCQSFSLAGKRLGESDPRGLLFFETLRFINCNKPKYFIIENVKGLLSDNNGETFRNWIQLLGQSENGNTFMFPHEDSLMYNLHWQVLNTKDYGLPQNRERVFLVGIRNDLPNSFVFPKGVPLKLRLKDILEDEVDEKYYLSDKAINGFINHAERHAEKGNGFKFTPTDGSDIAVTITTHEGSRGYNNFIKENSINVGNVNPSGNGMNGNVFSDEGLCPTLTTNKGEGIKIQVVGFERTEEAKIKRSKSIKKNGIDSGKFSERNLKLKDQDYSDTILANPNHQKEGLIAIGAMHGRNPENPNDRSKGGNYQQTLEINENGTSNCLSTVQKDNLVLENFVFGMGNIRKGMEGQEHLSRAYSQKDRVYNENGIAPTIMSQETQGRYHTLLSDFRIRKLTVRECARLQGFQESFDLSKVSNSQGYKQMGNTISVNVIQAILKNLLK